MAATKYTLFTFRTFPETLLSTHLPEAVVVRLGKLKADLVKLSTQTDVTFIGFALANDSRQEQVAVNRFNNGMIDRSGNHSIKLQTFSDLDIDLSRRPTRSFCNYAMYKLAQKYPVHFIHCTDKDFETVADYIKKLQLT